MTVFPDPNTPFGERVQRRLASAKVAWLTTVGADGTPQPNPVWFIVDGDDVIVYNRNDAKRLAHIAVNPRITVHLDGDGEGGDIIVLTGRAEIVANPTPANESPAYIAKYGPDIARVAGRVESFAADYATQVIIHVERVRGF
jgi:PPOX class probable F420-dependent enzyme